MSDIAEKVKSIVVEHLGVEKDKVTESSSFIDDLGADSLDTVELVMAFEEEFECEIPDDVAEKILTIKDAIEYIEKIKLNIIFSSMRRVVVTGIGMCSPLGFGCNISWDGLINSKSGINKLEGFEIDDLPSKVGGQLSLIGREDLFIDNCIEAKDKRKIETFIQYALSASKEAIEDSNWIPKNEKESERTGVMIGSGIGGLDGIRKNSESLNRSPRKVSPFFIPSCLINLASGHISIKYGYTGPNHSVVTACASGAHAIGDSARMIMLDQADVMIAGGSEAACTRFGIAGFSSMRALSTNFNDDPERLQERGIKTEMVL